MDLAAWWQARRWRALLELIEQLPQASRFQEAWQNDPDQARLIALRREYSESGEGPPEPWAPRLADYTLTVMLLREIVQNTAAAAGAKKPAYIPGPRTEVDRQVELIRLEHAYSVGARFGFSPEDFGLRSSP